MAVRLEAYQNLLEELAPYQAQLIVVSKTRSVEDIMSLYELGHRAFGENRVQELLPKYEALPKDIQWHLIGTLQSNKVKYIAPFVHCIHSLDRADLLPELEKQALKTGRVLEVLLQFHVAQEESKQGLDWAEAEAMLRAWTQKPPQNLRLRGLMGMASFSEDEALVKGEFETLATYFQRIKTEYGAHFPDFTELSMGMSGDYPLALQAGATWVRVGSKLFV